MIPFNIPALVDKEKIYMKQALSDGRISGDGPFTKKCSEWIEMKTGTEKVLLTTSCTHALEMAALLADIKEGDEVIMPSYTFVSTANAFVLRGANIVFIDIRPDTMNMDETLIENAITSKTKAIVPVHYAGVGCEMKTIMDIARNHDLLVIEDAAQSVMATYEDKALGTFGHFGCYSFHATKNYSMGEGGAILIGDESYLERAEIIREKGTDRSKFLRGQVDKYSWIDIGSSYLPSDLNAALLYAQLEAADEINASRLDRWHQYYSCLNHLQEGERIKLPYIPKECKHNAHMFYIKVKNLEERNSLAIYLKEKDVSAVFHYVPLHSSLAGRRYGRFEGKDRHTTKESECLLRLPMYFGLSEKEVDYVVACIEAYYENS